MRWQKAWACVYTARVRVSMAQKCTRVCLPVCVWVGHRYVPSCGGEIRSTALKDSGVLLPPGEAPPASLARPTDVAREDWREPPGRPLCPACGAWQRLINDARGQRAPPGSLTSPWLMRCRALRPRLPLQQAGRESSLEGRAPGMQSDARGVRVCRGVSGESDARGGRGWEGPRMDQGTEGSPMKSGSCQARG